MHFIAPFDCGSRHSGASNASWQWVQLLAETPNRVFERSLGAVGLHELEAAVRHVAKHGHVPFTLGGDHTLSFHCIRGLLSFYGELSVVHFDAHHDQYDGSQLNHYTVFNHVHRLGVPVFGVGYRHEGHAPTRLNEPIEGPVYVSVDVDYFDPRLVPGVGDAVPVLQNEPANLSTLKESLAQIRGRIVGIDLVEWYGTDDAEERQFIFSVFGVLNELKIEHERH